ncbi:MAG: ATP-binding protein [Proteobacteria bacterium]|nr:ATP-binding protein [Pseudomonadota bacterium]
MMNIKEILPDKSIALSIESRFENVSLVGITVKAICDFIFINKNEPYNMELSVTEAVTNAIKHAYNSEQGQNVEINIFVYSDKMVFKISDIGKGMNPTQCNSNHVCLDFEPDKIETLPVGGMGLHIINSLMDEVLYETIEGKNTITLVKFIKK